MAATPTRETKSIQHGFWLQCAAKCLADDKRQEALLNDLSTKYSASIFRAVVKVQPPLTGIMVKRDNQLYDPRIYPMLFAYDGHYLYDTILKDPANPHILDFYEALRRYNDKAPRGDKEGMNQHLYSVMVEVAERYLRKLLYADGTGEAAEKHFPDLKLNAVIDHLIGEGGVYNDFDTLVYEAAKALVPKTTKFVDMNDILNMTPTAFRSHINMYFIKCRDCEEEKNELDIADHYGLGLDELIILTSPYVNMWQLPPYTEEDYVSIGEILHDAAHPVPERGPIILDETHKTKLKEDRLVFQSFDVEPRVTLWECILHSITTNLSNCLVSIEAFEECIFREIVIKFWLKKMAINVDAYIAKVKTEIFPAGAAGALPGVANLIVEHL